MSFFAEVTEIIFPLVRVLLDKLLVCIALKDGQPKGVLEAAFRDIPITLLLSNVICLRGDD